MEAGQQRSVDSPGSIFKNVAHENAPIILKLCTISHVARENKSSEILFREGKRRKIILDFWTLSHLFDFLRTG